MPTAPVPCVSLTKMENLSFLSSIPTVLGCSCANNRPPSLVPTMPSALSGPCQTSFHLAPAAITPGMAVTVTSLAGAGCGKFRAPPAFRCCATAIARRNKSRSKQAASDRAHSFEFHKLSKVAFPASGVENQNSRSSFRVRQEVYSENTLPTFMEV